MVTEDGTDLLSRLATHVAELEPAELPAATLSCARRLLIDTVAAGLAGSAFDTEPSLVEVAGRWGRPATRAATVWGSGHRLPAATAAFVNAVQIHRLEFDCAHEEAVLHPMSALLAALLAEVQTHESPVSGAELLAAIVGGVDVSARLGRAATGAMRFFRPSALGVFGAAAAVARIRRYDAARVAAAMSHAYLQAAGTLQPHAEGTPQLSLQVGLAARAAVTAADLATIPMRSAGGIFTGTYGYYRLFEDGCDPGRVTERLGDQWAIEGVSQKPYPTGRLTHPAIGAALELHAGGWRTPTAIEVAVPPLVARLTGRRAQPGMEPGYARLCLAWLVAATLRHGPPRLCWFTEAFLRDPDILRMADTVVIAEREGGVADFGPQAVVVRDGCGHSAEAVAEVGLGHPTKPMSQRECKAKFLECCSAAGLSAGAAAQLLSRLDGVESITDVRALVGRLGHGTRAS